MTRLPARHRDEVEDTGSGRLRWQVTPPAVYYVTPSGDEWRVHDCVMKGGKLTRVELESGTATARVFVGPPDRGGVKKLYRFKPRERHELTASICERQLRESEYLGTTGPFDPSSRSAR